jgi:hypothetical protein
MRAFALTLGISAATLAGDIDFGGVGQTVVTSNDGDYSLDTRLVLGGYAESDGAVYGFSFETILMTLHFLMLTSALILILST